MTALLRFITCGSVDDGKSTLVGRLLYESKQVFDDHLSALTRDSLRFGTQGSQLDFALLVDGLHAEREQGITIDVAYRFFATPVRRFIVADTPGHEQYTRNMATGASTADLAILLVDARKGVLTQTCRHSRIVAMLGVKHVVVAVNKMDLVAWDRSVFEKIVRDYETFAADLRLITVQSIPMSALEGDNVVQASDRVPWYTGPALLPYLETVSVTPHPLFGGFRMPVQWVNRPNLDFRGFCGRISKGTARAGDPVRIAPGGMQTRIKSIIVYGRELAQAEAGDSVTLTLQDEVDVGRGDVIGAADAPVPITDQFEARVIWMSEKPLMAGRLYLLKLHAKQVGASVSEIKYRVDVDTGAHLAAKSLALNDIGVVNISTDRPVPFEIYEDDRRLGAFILIDRDTNQTVGAGMIDFALRRAANVHWQALSINKQARAGLKLQRPCCLWLTGLSGAGKSTIADLLEKRLHAEGRHTFLLDGDNVRHGLNRDLGFTEADRVENIRRVAEVAKLMVEAGLMVIVSFISPYRSERAFARSLFAAREFYEIFVSTPIAECERRDPKGLYAKARRGELKNFTGIDSAYEAPDSPDIRLDTMTATPAECAERVLQELDL
jgi:bifunctional enzyme CysN/CysC